jgi:glycosyltransferase involved in cell wall biosynthesis
MFTDLPPAPRVTAPIWGQPLDERLGQLFAKERRVAWVYRSPDTSTFRYRVANMVNAVNSLECSDVSAAWFSDVELDSINHLVGFLDAIVVARYPCSAPLLRLIERADHHAVPLLFDVDDLVFEPALVPLVMDAIGEDRENFKRWETWFAYTSQLQATAQACHAGLTTVPTLKARLAPYFQDGGVDVIPNFLDRDQETYSRALLNAKRASGWARSGPVTIGYFSGSPTHAHDFAVAAPALVRLLRNDADLRLRVVGSLDVVGDVADFSQQIEVVPFMDFLSLQRSIAEVEVNIAPLQHHEFTACKSELKYFEAAAVGTWTVASATPAFAACIDDGATGRVVRAHEWDEALVEAVRLARDPQTYAQRMEIAAERAYLRYGCHAHARGILDSVTRRRRQVPMG